MSDHCPILTNTLGSQHNQNNQSKFRLDADWLVVDDFEEILQSFWRNNSEALPLKLEMLGTHLQNWGRNIRAKRRRLKVNLEKKLAELSSNDPDDDTLAELLELFSDEQATQILNMHIPHNDTPDMIVWKAGRSGEYSVRSGYRLLIGATEGFSSSPTNQRDIEAKSFFKSLWSLPLPPKIKIFFWRFSNNLIPTLVNLSNQRMNVNTSCNFCNLEVESVEHLSHSCPFVQQILYSLGIEPPIFNQEQSWLEWLAGFFIKLSLLQRKLLTISYWAIWFMRNQKMHEDLQENVRQTVNFISLQLTEFEALGAKSNPHAMTSYRWSPPRPGIIKVNFDASVDAAHNSSVAGIILRNSEGPVMAIDTFSFSFVPNAETAEAKAVLWMVKLIVLLIFCLLAAFPIASSFVLLLICSVWLSLVLGFLLISCFL
ncbi:hypothetical protein V6N11_075236 [Hibiscus sabdariffa]|uniref:Reverse transcriptase zinc-binding domain-containing protein n=1 Tax=Hibiscus sabdariffa TaxID=183260 RepID=A0ABR2R5X7_9ROSI